MLATLLAHLRNQWIGVIALLLVLTGGTAYALDGSNTVFTDDLVNGDVKVADIGQGAVATDEIANSQVKAADIGDGEVKAAEIAAGQVAASELAANSVNAGKITDGQVRSPEIGNGQVEAVDLAPSASGARAWGLVNGFGGLLRGKNVTAVTSPVDGITCIDPGAGIDPDTSVMVVSGNNTFTDTNADQDQIAHFEWRSAAPNCPAGRMEVNTWLAFGTPASGGDIDEGGFDLTRFGQGFAFVIP